MSISVADKEWCAAKVLAWATWAGAVVFTLAAWLVNLADSSDATTLEGMVLCTFGIICAVGACAQHVIASVNELRARIQEAYEVGYSKGRIDEQDQHDPIRRIQ